MARSDHVRYQLYLPLELSKRIEDLASAPGVSKSAILVEALDWFLNRKGDSELEAQFAKRLDQTSKQLARLERNSRVLLETTGLFVRYMLSVNSPLPEGDEEGRALARQRFEAFVERVRKQVASGRFTFDPETLQ